MRRIPAAAAIMRSPWSVATVALVILGACTGTGGATRDTTFVAGTSIGTPPPNDNAGEWALPARDFASSRYSPLSQITPDNAKNLHVSWTFSTGVLRGHEGQP